MQDIVDLHTHTIASGHAYNTLYEMAKAASEHGVALFGSSDHGPAMRGASDDFYFVNFKVIPRDLFGIKLIMGCELNILDSNGRIDLSERYLKGLDYAIASIHDFIFKKGSIKENTNACLNAMKNPYVQIIGHPDDGRIPLDYETLVEGAKKSGKLLEVNSSSLHPLCPRLNARENYIQMLTLCRRMEVPVILGSDAHVAADAGNHTLALQLLEELHFPDELVVNTSPDKLLPFIPKLKNYL